MINVNLRPGQKRKRAGGSPLKGITDAFQVFTGKVKDPLLIAVAAAWVLALGFVGTTWVAAKARLASLEPRLEQTRSEHHRFTTFLAQKRKQELIRDSLLAQIGVIKSVDGDRFVWPHVLDEVTKALPAYTWLTGVFAEQTLAASTQGAPQAPANQAGKAAPADTSQQADSTAKRLTFKIEGRTVDIQAYTRFLRQLEASPWLNDVTAVSVSTVVEQERPVSAFVIRAAYKQADSAYVKTVSLSESVR